MRTKFDQMMENLHQELIDMGNLCEKAITCAVHALIFREDNMAEQAFAIERLIDQKEREIESQCMNLLLRQQPVARDLRDISVALKMIRDMERIGDQAADIAEITRHIPDDHLFGRLHIKEMAEAAIKMVTDSVNAFVERNSEAARQVIDDDDKVDDLFRQVRQELVGLIAEDAAVAEYCIDILMIAKYLERIGDHATNIAEW